MPLVGASAALTSALLVAGTFALVDPWLPLLGQPTGNSSVIPKYLVHGWFGQISGLSKFRNSETIQPVRTCGESWDRPAEITEPSCV
jgi:hypothetical protein